MAGRVSLFDISILGYAKGTSGEQRLYDAEALHNALKLFLLSSKGDYLGDPNRGGFLINKLMKPMRLVDVADIVMSVDLALQQDFRPQIKTYQLSVTPDYENRLWNVSFTYVCPSLKLAGSFKEQIVGKAA